MSIISFHCWCNAMVYVHLSVSPVCRCWSSSAPEGMKRETEEREVTAPSMNWQFFYSSDCFTAARNYWKHFYRVPILWLMDFIVISHQLRVTRNALMKFPQTWRTRPLKIFTDTTFDFEKLVHHSQVSFRCQFYFAPAKCQTMGIQHRELFIVRKIAMTFESRLGRRRKKLFNCLQSSIHPGIVLLTGGGINATYCHGLISKLTSSGSEIVVEGVSVTSKSLSLKCFEWNWSFLFYWIKMQFLGILRFVQVLKRLWLSLCLMCFLLIAEEWHMSVRLWQNYKRIDIYHARPRLPGRKISAWWHSVSDGIQHCLLAISLRLHSGRLHCVSESWKQLSLEKRKLWND